MDDARAKLVQFLHVRVDAVAWIIGGGEQIPGAQAQAQADIGPIGPGQRGLKTDREVSHDVRDGSRWPIHGAVQPPDREPERIRLEVVAAQPFVHPAAKHL